MRTDISIGDCVVILDDRGKTTSKHGIIIAELTKEQMAACQAAAEALDPRAVWPGGIRVFVVFVQPDDPMGDEDRLRIYCDAFLSVVQPDYSRN